MPVEFVLLGESFFTEVALVWSVSFMNPFMIFKVRAFDKALITECTLIRLNACHTGVMITLVFFVTKNFTAYITLIFFWGARYYCYMTAITTFDVLILLHGFFEFFFCLITLKKQKYMFHQLAQ